jgi:REP element-mobilizing transposase RayT
MAQNYYSELYYHYVWRTKGNLALIVPEIKGQLLSEIISKSRELGAYPLEVGGTVDHMHLLVGAPPTLLPSDFIGKVKGSTSHYVNHQLNSPCRLHWNESYGVLSLAKRDVPAVRRYIQDQVSHHTRGTTNKKMECCDSAFQDNAVTPVNGGKGPGMGSATPG